MTTIFDQFKPEEKTHFIEALGGEVTLRDLTLAELSEITNSIVDGVDADGQPKMDMRKALSLKYVKLSKALVDPKMSSDDLESLSGKAKGAIKELMFLVDPVTAEAEAAAEAEALGVENPNESEK